MEYLAKFEGARVSEKVRAELISRLAAGEPSRADVASALHMSEKTLQRRLKGEETSYQEILDETRRELARQYLREGRMSVCEVTFRLGFSDQSSFTRAFKRWTGLAPGEFRHRTA
ncbi:helix-turn-helix transcriptional regulator [Tepidimonas fonticaldi]